MNRYKRLNIRIADVGIDIDGHHHLPKWEVPKAYRPFINGGKGEIAFQLHSGIPEFQVGEKAFDSAPIWSLHRHNGTSVINIFDKFPDLKRVLVLPRHLEQADLYFTEKPDHRTGPFFGPTMELLLINYLARERGIILHACGVERQAKGYLFAGESGAGKSTLARLWDQEKDVEVLSDDRTIVRKQDGEFRMYGTPWHGDAPFGSPRGVRLEKIFFLDHAPRNAIRKLNGTDLMLQFLKCSFPPYWDAAGMEFSMEFFNELADGVSCRTLCFKPDKSVIEFVKEGK